MIDFHCHLDLYPNPDGAALAAHRQSRFVLSVTTTPSAFEGTKALANGRPQIHTALGLHPQLAAQRYRELRIFDELAPTTPYIGEIGLDGAPENRATWRKQLDVFEHILKTCSGLGGRIMSIHSRRASAGVLDLLRSYPDSGVAVLHWFSGSSRDLDRAVEHGCWFSVGPPMVNSERGRALIERMPKDRVLTETDGPFAQKDGRPLVPADAERAAKGLAELWGVDDSEASATLLDNLSRLTASASAP